MKARENSPSLYSLAWLTPAVLEEEQGLCREDGSIVCPATSAQEKSTIRTSSTSGHQGTKPQMQLLLHLVFGVTQ